MYMNEDPQIPHPLLLPSIVSDVLDYLPVEQIKQCRFVCTTWHGEASSILKKRRCRINLSTVTRVKRLIQRSDTQGNLSVTIGSSLGKKNTIVQSFFKKHGKSIVSLQLCSPTWSASVSLRKFLAQYVPNLEILNLQLVPAQASYGHIPTWNHENPAHELYSLKKLKRLEFLIDYSKYWSILEQDKIKPFLRHLISGMPNLETISCPRYPENFIETFQYEVEILFRESPNLRPLICLLTESDAPNLQNLKNFDIPLKFWTNIPSLQARNYPLEILDWFIGLEVTSQQIQNFLSQVGKTLKIMSLDFTTAGKFLREVNFEPCNSFPSPITFQNLHTLSLRSFKGSLGLILQIPHLKYLNLTKARSLDVFFDEVHFNKSTIYTPLINLTIDQHNPKDSVDPVTLERIGCAFPNLKKFEIRFLSDNALRSLCMHFSSLEELVASDGIFTDAGVTGMSLSRLDTVLENKFGVPFKCIAKYRKDPYIGSLKNLKKLDLRSKHVTGLSTFFGILDCSYLTSLTLMGYGFSNISLITIADELNLSFFKTIYCHQLTVAGVEYIKKRMSRCELSLNELQKPLNGLDIYRLGLFQSGTIPVRKKRIAMTPDMEQLATEDNESNYRNSNQSKRRRRL